MPEHVDRCAQNAAALLHRALANHDEHVIKFTEAWVGTTHAVGQRVTAFVRIYSSITVSHLASEIISIDLSLRTEENTSVGSPDSDSRHCSQAEANDAAAAQMAAQTPSDDNKTSIQNASLVSARAI